MSALDFALLLMVVVWGANFSAIKYALGEFSPITFNALRLVLASAVFLIAIALRRRARLTRDDWRRIVALGVLGHFLYQLVFLFGLARTSVSNSALIFGATPISVALLGSAMGHERVRPSQWLGAALSMAGIYVIVGRSAAVSGATLAGDAMVFCGMLCWSIYSVMSQPLLRRHSPLSVTGYSMAIGAALFVIVSIPSFLSTNWRAISALSWTLMTLSSLLALAFAYMVWYTAVQRIGSFRTAIYSNLTPIVAMIVAAVSLGEPVGRTQIAGAAMILGGVFIARFPPPLARPGKRATARQAPPPAPEA